MVGAAKSLAGREGSLCCCKLLFLFKAKAGHEAHLGALLLAASALRRHAVHPKGTRSSVAWRCSTIAACFVYWKIARKPLQRPSSCQQGAEWPHARSHNLMHAAVLNPE